MAARRTALLVALGILFALGQGCGSPDPPAQAPSGVSYLRTGGLAGTAESLVIAADGSAILAVSRRARLHFRVGPATLAALRRDLDAAKFEDLPRNDRSIPEPDGFNYVLAYRGHLVIREQSGIEPSLRPAVNRLQTIVDSRR